MKKYAVSILAVLSIFCFVLPAYAEMKLWIAKKPLLPDGYESWSYQYDSHVCEIHGHKYDFLLSGRVFRADKPRNAKVEWVVRKRLDGEVFNYTHYVGTRELPDRHEAFVPVAEWMKLKDDHDVDIKEGWLMLDIRGVKENNIDANLFGRVFTDIGVATAQEFGDTCKDVQGRIDTFYSDLFKKTELGK